jgi:Zn-dependent metalloprotease/fibronectin type 3 domain-containing protein
MEVRPRPKSISSRLSARVVFGAVIAVVVAGGSGVMAFGASSPQPPPSPSKARSIAAEQASADVAGQALRLGSGEKLVVKDVIRDADGSTHVRYNRTFDGLRVIGGDFVSHRDKSGRTKSVSWSGSRHVAVASTKPRISLASAEAVGDRKALSVQKKASASTQGELVVYSVGASGKPTPKLAYDVLKVGFRADQTPSRLHTIVDANTGATLGSYDEIEHATGTGNGIRSGAVSLGTTAGPPYLMRDTVGNYTTDLNGAVTGTGTTFTDADNVWGNGTNTDPASAGVDAHYAAEKTFDYFKNVQGRNGIWDNGVGVLSRVHYGDSYVNSFWDGSAITYGDGANNAQPLTELDVAGHEMSHGITQNTAGLVDTGEAGGLNEATSDIFGTAVEFYANNPADNPDYLIGELININGNGTPLRYMDQPSRDGVSADCWSSTLGNLDPHYSSGPLNHWFYLASEGSGAKVLNGVSYNSSTCGGAPAVTAIGRDKAAKIWYRTLTTYLTSGSTYASAREGAVQSAKDLYGATSQECTSVAASFSAIAVPPGAATCGVTPPPSVGNLLSNPGFESGDTLWSAAPSVIDQWLGAGEPAHSGTWSAWLCGYGSTHDDSISQLVAIPASSSATLSYYLHIDTDEAPNSQAYDTMTVRAGSTVLQTLSNLDAANGYQLRTVDLSAYVGRTVSLSFTGSEDASAATSFVVDDTSVTTPTASTAPGAPTGLTATAGDAQAVVSWTAPVSDGGSAITGYTVTASPGGASVSTAGATSGTVSGLANGTAYTFTVTATNSAGTSLASSPSAAVTPRTVPGAPTAVSATPGNAQVVVSWTAPASNGGSAITGYTVTASPGGASVSTAGATSGTVSGLANGTAYTFTVTATNSAGTSLASSPSAAVTPRTVPTVPGAPTGVTAMPDNAQAVVSWTAPASNGGSAITAYTVTASPGGASVSTSGATSGTVNGLTNGTEYTFTVTASNGVGTSPASSPSAVVTPRTVPGVPTVVTATAGNAQAVVSWAAPVSDGGSAITGYTVQAVVVSTGLPFATQSAAAGASSLTFPSLNNTVSYQFRALATNGVGAGPYSAPSNVVTPKPTAAVTRLSDFNRDGFTDLVSRETSTGNLYLYQGDGAGGFKTRVLMGTGWNIFTALVTPGDVTGDGNADVLARDAAGALYLYPGNGASGVSARRRIGLGWNVFDTVTNAADMVGSGGTNRPDILAREASTGILYLYPLTGNVKFGTRISLGTGWGQYTLNGPGDVSGDGRADILARDPGGSLWMYTGNGAGAVTARFLVPPSSPAWAGMSPMVTPGNWDRAVGNDVLGQDASGILRLLQGDNAGGFGPGLVIGNGWGIMNYLG